MAATHHPLTAHLVDLEIPFAKSTVRAYEPVDLVRHALTASDYWAGLALQWVEQGVPASNLLDSIRRLESERWRSQALRHRARRVRTRR